MCPWRTLEAGPRQKLEQCIGIDESMNERVPPACLVECSVMDHHQHGSILQTGIVEDILEAAELRPSNGAIGQAWKCRHARREQPNHGDFLAFQVDERKRPLAPVLGHVAREQVTKMAFEAAGPHGVRGEAVMVTRDDGAGSRTICHRPEGLADSGKLFVCGVRREVAGDQEVISLVTAYVNSDLTERLLCLPIGTRAPTEGVLEHRDCSTPAQLS